MEGSLEAKFLASSSLQYLPEYLKKLFLLLRIRLGGILLKHKNIQVNIGTEKLVTGLRRCPLSLQSPAAHLTLQNWVGGGLGVEKSLE